MILDIGRPPAVDRLETLQLDPNRIDIPLTDALGVILLHYSPLDTRDASRDRIPYHAMPSVRDGGSHS